MQLDHLGDTQRRIVEILATRPSGTTIDDLVIELQITKSAVREHVAKLDALGYLFSESIRLARGRPRKIYSLNASGSSLFSKQYAWLTKTMLGWLRGEMGEAATAEIMRKLGRGVAASLEKLFASASGPRERMMRLNKLMNELGYQSRIRQSDLRKGIVLEASNCAYHEVAKSDRELCEFDRSFLAAASGGLTVVQESCIQEGAPVCRFCFRADPAVGSR